VTHLSLLKKLQWWHPVKVIDIDVDPHNWRLQIVRQAFAVANPLPGDDITRALKFKSSLQLKILHHNKN
jgi:hypothetical protein